MTRDRSRDIAITGVSARAMLQALVDLAAPDLTDTLDAYFDGQRRRVKRALVSGG